MGEWMVLYGGVLAGAPEREREVSMLRVSSGEWVSLPCSGAAPSGRAWHSATAVGETMLLVYGGSNGKKLFGDVHSLDLAEWLGDMRGGAHARWTKLQCDGEAPPPRMGHTAVLMAGERLWLYGGFVKGGAKKEKGAAPPASAVHELDLAALCWRSVALAAAADGDGAPVRARLGSCAFEHGGAALVFGGSVDGCAVNELVALDGTALTAARVDAAGAAAVTPRHSAAAALCAADDYAIIHGGCECWPLEGGGTHNRVLHDVLLLDLRAMAWAVLAPAGPAPGLRFKHSLCAVAAASGNGGRRAVLFVFGGSDGAAQSDDAVPPSEQLWRLDLHLPPRPAKDVTPQLLRRPRRRRPPPRAAGGARAGGDDGQDEPGGDDGSVQRVPRRRYGRLVRRLRVRAAKGRAFLRSARAAAPSFDKGR